MKEEKRKINPCSWHEYVKGYEAIFEEMKEEMVNTIKFRSPNEKVFRILLDILKDKYGTKKIDFLIIDIGFTKLYSILESSRLFDLIKIIGLINETFNYEYFKEYDIRILDAFKRDGGHFSLFITNDNYLAISRLSQDIKLTISEFGLIGCIFTFNMAQEEFKGLIAERFKMCYKDDGYIQTIRERVDKIVKEGIIWMANILPMMIEEVEHIHIDMELNNIKKEEMIEEMLYKEQTIDEISNMLLNFASPELVPPILPDDSPNFREITLREFYQYRKNIYGYIFPKSSKDQIVEILEI